MPATRLRRNLRLGIKSLLLHKLRSMLTMLGVVFGVASVASFSQLDVYRIDMSRQVNIAYHAFQYKSFYYFPTGFENGVAVVSRIEQRWSGLETTFQFPFNSKYRFARPPRSAVESPSQDRRYPFCTRRSSVM